MTTLSIPTTTWADGSPLPLVGLGTYKLNAKDGVRAISHALEAGYRLIDTAAQYNNEATVGEAIRASGVDRHDIVVTTKVAGGSQGAALTRMGVEMSLARLGLDRIDIVLIHWPNPSRGLAEETWQALIEMRHKGLIGHIGTSNFRPEQLQRLEDATGVRAEINQIQLSPVLARWEAVEYHRSAGILTQAWGPLGMREGALEHPVIQEIARELSTTPEQVCLRWAVDRGVVVIPKSADPARQIRNASLGDVIISDVQRARLDSLDMGEECAWDSRTHEEW